MPHIMVDREALRRNIRTVRDAVGVPVMGVVKGNGMGLGPGLAQTLLEEGISVLATASVAEGVALRERGIDCEILVLGSTALPDEAQLLVRHRLTAAVGSAAAAAALEQAAARQDAVHPVHLKLDTGFGRFGFLPGEEQTAAQALQASPHLTLAGAFSHLSMAFYHSGETAAQRALFLQMLERLSALGVAPPLLHLANSCGALLHPDTRFDLVRVGSAFLGRLPVPAGVQLTPVGSLACRVIELHDLPKGHNIGYTNVYTTRRPTRTAVLDAGVQDGLLHARGKDAFRPVDRMRYLWHAVKGLRTPAPLTFTIRGQRAAAVGRIGMTHTVVDVTGLGVEPGDTAELACNPLMMDSALERRFV